jgi:hypothetical protein
MGAARASSLDVASRWATGNRLRNPKTSTPKEINMKFRNVAIATVFASMLGATAAVHAETKDFDHLNGYSRMTYSNVYVNGGQTAEVGVRGTGSANLRLTVFDNNNHLITTTVCRYDNCILSWTAAWNGNYYVTVENLSAYGTDYAFVLERE